MFFFPFFIFKNWETFPTTDSTDKKICQTHHICTFACKSWQKGQIIISLGSGPISFLISSYLGQSWEFFLLKYCLLSLIQKNVWNKTACRLTDLFLKVRQSDTSCENPQFNISTSAHSCTLGLVTDMDRENEFTALLNRWKILAVAWLKCWLWNSCIAE